MARQKSRVEHLAAALKATRAAEDCLAQIDLRTTRGDLREHVKSARQQTQESIRDLEAAVRLDVPTLPSTKKKPTSALAVG